MAQEQVKNASYKAPIANSDSSLKTEVPATDPTVRRPAPSPNSWTSSYTWPPVGVTLKIPLIERAPTSQDFNQLMPVSDLPMHMAHIDDFTMRFPADGVRPSQKTEAYLGYDHNNLYVVFACFDSTPAALRAQIAKRETVFDDDLVDITIDTYKDKRRGFIFVSNPVGIQSEGIFDENNGEDYSWDTVWKTTGLRTANGYMVIMAIPFRSLRFSHADVQNWGFVLRRIIPRNNERSFWPYLSQKINSRLEQESALTGMEHISPGRNIQINPYGVWRADRALNTLDSPPRFEGETLGGRVGMDAKMILKDSLTLDFTLKPDFSQVESDSPQITINQRFPVYFPEKRPFFLENSNYFNTPYSLLYTRNIADPEYGARLTGKIEKVSLGFIFANDRSPGQSVPVTDPEFGKKAQFAIGRVNYDLFGQSTIGVIYTDREFDGSFNRIGGLDGSFKWKKNYFAEFQLLESSTRSLSGNYSAGPAFVFGAGYSDQHKNFNTRFEDNSQGFQTSQVGFYTRPDYIRFSNFANYRWRPKKNPILVSFGPNLWEDTNFDHSGNMLDWAINPGFNVEFKHSVFTGCFYEKQHSTVRPKDIGSLSAPLIYENGGKGCWFENNYFKRVNFNMNVNYGDTLNFIPVSGPPRPAREQGFNGGITFKPLDRLQINTSYIGDFLHDTVTRQSLFNTHIIRTKVSYQLNKEASFRFIGQYNANLSHPSLVSLDTTKSFNYDFLFTYFVHPGTALYVGYNTNLSTLDPNLVQGPNGFVQRSNKYINDGRQVFVKLSYLFRF